jgi:hypothetical protein
LAQPADIAGNGEAGRVRCHQTGHRRIQAPTQKPSSFIDIKKKTVASARHTCKILHMNVMGFNRQKKLLITGVLINVRLSTASPKALMQKRRAFALCMKGFKARITEFAADLTPP